MMSGVHVEQRHRDVRRAKGLFRQTEEAERVFAAREQERRTLELGGDFAHDMNRFRLQILQMVEVVGTHVRGGGLASGIRGSVRPPSERMRPLINFPA